MKDERNVRRRRTAGRIRRSAAILMAAVLMALSLPAGRQPAYATVPDPEQECSLTVNIGTTLTDEERQDLEEAAVVVDLYRIADAEPVNGYETYSWAVLEPFLTFFAEKGVSVSASIDSSGWREVAKAAAEAALGTVPEGTEAMAPAPVGSFSATQVVRDQPVGSPITGLPAGLYLIVPHGSNDTEYVSTSTVTGIAGEETSQVTLALSRHYKYSFSPELISLPTKEGLNTAQNAGTWEYDGNVDLTMKYSREKRIGALEITKTLLTNAERGKDTPAGDGTETERAITDPATFVFEVSVYDSEELYNSGAAPDIFHDFISIIFDANGDYSIIGANEGQYASDSYGSRTARIENLPIGSYAVVKEVYAGAVYTGYPDQCATIEVNENANTIGVTFENDYNEGINGGGSVTNKFTCTKDPATGDDKWSTLDQVTDSTQDTETEDPIQHVGSQ
ncbi:MAG: hypothetical protein Q4D81_08295 [Eubacteriales bacterium]|nr:hypothetical protein [Eubacteriales bacterium]